MAIPWKTIATADTPDGVLELRRRGERDFLILINNRVLMNSRTGRSEAALGELACRAVGERPQPRVLIGGLGMGITLRAALDALPSGAGVVVAELNPVVAEWCRGALAGLTNGALHDPRSRVELTDVASLIAGAAMPGAGKFDAIIIDLYEGPHAKTDARNDPFYGSRALSAAYDTLAENGVFAVWGEAPDAGFEERLAAAGFDVKRHRPGRGGLRHVVYVARKVKRAR